MNPSAEVVVVQRQWNDWRQATYNLSDIRNVHWSNESGGVRAPSPQYFMHGYVFCTAMIEGELAHSGAHGSCPHEIKVCIVKKYNHKDALAALQEAAGPNPNLGQDSKTRGAGLPNMTFPEFHAKADQHETNVRNTGGGVDLTSLQRGRL